MRKWFIALVAALTIAGSMVAVTSEADARSRGGAVAAGVLGGLAAGAIIGAATAPYYYAPPPPAYYAPPPAYYAPAPVYYERPCRWVKQRYWDGYYWQVRRVQVC